MTMVRVLEVKHPCETFAHEVGPKLRVRKRTDISHGCLISNTWIDQPRHARIARRLQQVAKEQKYLRGVVSAVWLRSMKSRTEGRCGGVVFSGARRLHRFPLILKIRITEILLHNIIRPKYDNCCVIISYLFRVGVCSWYLVGSNCPCGVMGIC